MQRDLRIRVILIGIGLLLAVGVAGFLLWTSARKPSPEVFEPSAAELLRSERESTAQRPDSRSPNDDHVEVAPPPEPNVTFGVVTPDEGAGDGPTEPPVEPERALGRVTIVAIDRNGQPIHGLPLSYDTAPLERKGSGRISKDNLRHSAYTDTRGMITFTCNRANVALVAAPTDWALLVEAGYEQVDEELFGAFGVSVERGMLVLMGGRHAEETHTIRCLALTHLQIRVKYDDGKLGEGTLDFAQWSNRRGERASQLVSAGKALPIDGSGCVTIPIVPDIGHIGIAVFSQRPNWRREVRLAQDTSVLSELEVIIPAADPQRGYLKLVVTGLDVGERVQINIRGEYSFTFGTFAGVGNGVLTSSAIPVGSKVHVYVTGAKAWVSDEIVVDGDLREIEVTPTTGSTVLLRAVDADGAPVVPCALVRETWNWVSMAQPDHLLEVRTSGDFATADKDGSIRFTGLASGTHKLLLLARGYEAQLVNYSVSAGGTADLGTITVRKYSGDEGVVRLRVVGASDFSAFTCSLDTFGSPGGVRRMPLGEDGTAQFRDLFYRRYLVYVTRKADRKIWQKHVQLSTANPTAEVEIDVSHPDG